MLHWPNPFKHTNVMSQYGGMKHRWLSFHLNSLIKIINTQLRMALPLCILNCQKCIFKLHDQIAHWITNAEMHCHLNKEAPSLFSSSWQPENVVWKCISYLENNVGNTEGSAFLPDLIVSVLPWKHKSFCWDNLLNW